MKTALARIATFVTTLATASALHAQWCVVPAPPTKNATPTRCLNPCTQGWSGPPPSKFLCTSSPCYAATGGYTTGATDLQINTPGFPLMVARHYESEQAIDSLIGIGWTLNLAARLHYTTYAVSATTSNTEADVTMPNGQRYRFIETVGAAGSTFSPATDRYDSLVRRTDGSYLLTIADGSAKYTFASSGELLSVVDEWGNTLTFTYDGTGRLQRVADASGSGRYLDVYYGGSGRISTIQDNSGRQILFSYATDGTLTTVTDPAARQQRYEYTNIRFGPVLTRIRDPWNRIITDVTYDALARVTSYTEGGETYSYTYNYNNQPDQTSKIDTAGNRWTTTYSPDGFVTRRDAPGQGNTQTVYNADRSIQMLTDQVGVKTYYTYAGMGRIASMTRDYQGTQAIKFDYAYDTTFPFKVIARIPKNAADGSHDPNWQGWKYDYYQAGSSAPGALWHSYRVLTDGVTTEAVVTYEYDSRGRLMAETDAAGARTDYAYDANGDLATVTQASNRSDGTRPVISYAHDTLGRVTAVTDARGKTTTFTYDALDRIITVTPPPPQVGSPVNFTATFTHDSFDTGTQFVSTIRTDPNGRTTTEKYDVYGRLRAVVDSAGNTTSYTYTKSLLTGITDAHGYTSSYAYDAAERLTTTTFPDGATESYGYTPDGRLQSRTNRNNQTIQYTYDHLRRPTSVAYPNGTSITTTYVGQKLTQIVDNHIAPSETHTFTYDDRFRLTTETQGARGTNNYTYTAGDRVATQTPTGGPTTTFAYYANGSVDTINWTPVAGQFHYEYLLNGRYERVVLPNNQTRAFTYDDQDRLIQLSNETGSGGVLARYTFGYDVNWNGGSQTTLGERTSLVSTVPAQGLSAAETKYYYDARYQVTQTTYAAASPFNGEQHSWTYDGLGNRTSASINGTPISYTYQRFGVNPNNSQRLVSVGSEAYTYDADGNTLTRGAATLSWDYDDRLLSVVTATGTTSYKYDYQGRRVSTTSNGVTTTYLYNGWNVVRETTGTVTADHLLGPTIDEPLATVRGTTLTYHLVDGLGSVTGGTDATGTVQNSYVYDVWGVTKSALEAASQPFRFTGREAGYADDLLYYRHRFFSPRIGRFVSEDPLRFDAGPTFYAYARNTPARHRDPFGLQVGVNGRPTTAGNPDCPCGENALMMAAIYSYAGNVYAAYAIAKMLEQIANRATALGRPLGFGPAGGGGPGDAMMHCMFQCEATKLVGPGLAGEIGLIHENCAVPMNDPLNRSMDFHNNEVGRSLGSKGKSGDCKKDCEDALSNRTLTVRHPRT